MLDVNSKAPVFTLPDQDGNMISLQQFAGTYIVLYFYPKDDTPGCTAEACSLRDNYRALAQYAMVIGISADSSESHKKFAEKFHLPFTLLADTTKEVIKAYGAGGAFIKRITYLIDPTGVIVKAYPKVNPSQHAEEILKDLKELKK